MESSPSTQPHDSDLPITLLQLLSNSLVLYQTTPYLPVASLLALGATSNSFKELVHDTPNVFRHVDLTRVRQAQFEIAAIDHGGEVWRNVQLDENVTEDDFYGGPLRGILNTLKRRHILRDVQTLVLDGLSVTSDLVCEILLLEDYNVRLLSIREVQNLNERKLQQALIYAVRPSRPTNTPKLQGLYIFGAKDASPVRRLARKVSTYPAGIDSSYGGVIRSHGAQIGARGNQKSGETLADELESGSDKWYQASGKVIGKVPSQEWAHAIFYCQGIISFDAVLCRGPRHSTATFESEPHAKAPWYHSRCSHLSSRVATHALSGCVGCGKAPEGFSKFGTSPLSHFPLLAPPPLHSSTSKSAKVPFLPQDDRLLVRCMDCLKGRFCENCHKWWCEDCYEIPDNAQPQGSPEPWETVPGTIGGHPEKHVKVHMGLCVEDCLVAEMTSGAGSNGMWG
ncbi:hypothetical protein BDZ45DRAFT_600896 [Acephala macrosclerotiorum]|nr:hypothetical protein BDZ45DRAFT_600896 [Acephala macrosclerotiorum]